MPHPHPVCATPSLCLALTLSVPHPLCASPCLCLPCLCRHLPPSYMCRSDGGDFDERLKHEAALSPHLSSGGPTPIPDPRAVTPLTPGHGHEALQAGPMVPRSPVPPELTTSGGPGSRAVTPGAMPRRFTPSLSQNIERVEQRVGGQGGGGGEGETLACPPPSFLPCTVPRLRGAAAALVALTPPICSSTLVHIAHTLLSMTC